MSDTIIASDTLTRKVVLSVLVSIALWGLVTVVSYAILLALSKYG